MTDDQIIAIAERHAQYRDAQHLTLRGDGIVQFARDLLAQERPEVVTDPAKINAAFSEDA